MASAFPGGQDTWTTKTDNIDTVFAADVDNLQNAVAALEIGGVSTQNIAYAASITPNVPAGQYVIVGTLTGNITINAPTNPGTGGRQLTFRFTQDGTGGRTVTWNAVFSVTNWTVNTAANAKTEATFTYDGSNWVLASNPALAVNGLQLEKGGLWFNPVAYGAKFDGVTSDAAAWLLVIAALTPSRGSQLTVVAALGELVLPGGTSVVPVDTIIFRNFSGLKVRGSGSFTTSLNVTGVGTNGVYLNGARHAVLEGVHVQCQGTITNAINWEWGDFGSGGSPCTASRFVDIGIDFGSGTFVTAFAVGTNNSQAQCDSGTFENVTVTGNFSGDAAHFTNGLALGSGAGGNNYNHVLTNVSPGNCQNGVKCSASSFWQFGGQPGQNQVDYAFTTTPVVTATISGVQSQQSTRLLTVTGGTSPGGIHLSDVTWDASLMNADNQFIQVTAAQSVALDNVSVHGAAAAPVIQATPQSAARFQSITTRGCRIPTAVGALVVVVGGFNTTTVEHIGYLQTTLADIGTNITGFWTNRAAYAGLAAPAYSAAITPDASQGPWQTITVTNNTAFTVNAPTNPPDAIRTAELTIEILNSSGGAMGVITWNAALVLVGGAFTNPASTKRRFIRFEWNGANWIETGRASADY